MSAPLDWSHREEVEVIEKALLIALVALGIIGAASAIGDAATSWTKDVACGTDKSQCITVEQPEGY